MRATLPKIFLFIIWAGLVACSGGAGSPEVVVGGSTSSGLSNQAGPVERPPVNVDSGPQGDCSRYRNHAEDFEADDVPELCLEIWENVIKYPLHHYTPPEPNFPTRVIPTIDGPAVIDQDQMLVLHPQQIDLQDELNRHRIEIPTFP